MPDIKTICLEIVRAGPTHNQLLSPLTRYLALCGDFPATSLSVRHDHRYFMRRLRELEYTDKQKAEKRRRATLDELGCTRHQMCPCTQGPVAVQPLRLAV